MTSRMRQKACMFCRFHGSPEGVVPSVSSELRGEPWARGPVALMLPSYVLTEKL